MSSYATYAALGLSYIALAAAIVLVIRRTKRREANCRAAVEAFISEIPTDT